MRTTLWLVPTVMVIAATALFALSLTADRLAGARAGAWPSFVTSGSPDAAREVLIAIAAAVITVAGVVFSITILVLQLASQQFGPRMLRNFIRDLGTQVSLGAFVATFVFAVLVLGSVQSAPARDFVPHLSVTVSLVLLLVDLGVLIYFIHHVASSIQLTSVVSGIANDFRWTVTNLRADAAEPVAERLPGDVPALAAGLEREGAVVSARTSGFLQAVGLRDLLAIATGVDARILLLRRPGHFVLEGQPIARVLPVDAAARVAAALTRVHIVGPNRTLAQDPSFAVDQLVEVALRSLSPAINDTFTALNCIDWLGDCLRYAVVNGLPDGVHRDPAGTVRIIQPVVTVDRLVKGATDKIRQAGVGMPAVLIRQLENLGKLRDVTRSPELRILLDAHAALILETADASITVPSDLADVRTAFDAAVGG